MVGVQWAGSIKGKFCKLVKWSFLNLISDEIEFNLLKISVESPTALIPIIKWVGVSSATKKGVPWNILYKIYEKIIKYKNIINLSILKIE